MSDEPERLRVTDCATVTEGRLRKRIAKLMQQRDHWRAHAERLEYALRIAPGIRQSVEKYERLRARAERLHELEISHWAMVHEVERLTRERGSLQARIDALMLEYCPDEMTPEQMAEWARSQTQHHLTEPERDAMQRALKRSQAVADAGAGQSWPLT